ncbi:MAG: regulatory protein RecX [Oscillospiraceae bacterium]|nr:regulatory protein RecX [Oscillospiraceae bacterium]
MVITGIKKCRGRLYRLEFDDDETQMVHIGTFEESPYKIGSVLTDLQLEELVTQSNKRRAKEKALYLLSMRDYSLAELEKKLRLVADPNTAAETAKQMQSLGYIDDERFAKQRAQYLIKHKLYPKRRVVMELCRLGVDRETAQNATESIESNDVRQALALLNKKHYNKKSCNYINKAAAALARYGFDSCTIRRAIEMWQTEEQDFDIDEL